MCSMYLQSTYYARTVLYYIIPFHRKYIMLFMYVYKINIKYITESIPIDNTYRKRNYTSNIACVVRFSFRVSV